MKNGSPILIRTWHINILFVIVKWLFQIVYVILLIYIWYFMLCNIVIAALVKNNEFNVPDVSSEDGFGKFWRFC